MGCERWVLNTIPSEPPARVARVAWVEHQRNPRGSLRGLAAWFGARGGGETRAWLLSSLAYALVHVWAFNFMLLAAALVCGLFWGALYRWRKNLAPVIVSHAVWDVEIFILFPVPL